jgi:hypothetical protein
MKIHLLMREYVHGHIVSDSIIIQGFTNEASAKYTLANMAEQAEDHVQYYLTWIWAQTA